jgi:GTP-binding protein HflX
MVNQIIEKAVFVGIIQEKDDERKVKEYLEELEFLAVTAGVQGDKKFVQRISKPDKGTYIGTGKLEEINNIAKKMKFLRDI